MSRQKPDRVLGPYRHGAGWRIVIRRDSVSTPGLVLSTREEAERAKVKAEQGLAREQATAPLTVRAALDLYLADMHERGLREGSIDSVQRRIVCFLGAALDKGLSALTGERVQALLKDLATRPSRYGRPYSAAWIKVTIVALRTWGKWLVSEKRMAVNVFADLAHRGKMNKGKVKLTLDEARTYARTAHAMADAGDETAVMALCALYLGMRKGEIQDLTTRALDDQGRRLIVFRSKTDAGRRTIAIPVVLRPYLARAAQGKAPGEFLFSNRSKTALNSAVLRICKAAGVPVVVPHSFRGLIADLAVASGEVLDRVASVLGHAGTKVTRDHYADAGALDDQARAKGHDLLLPDPDKDED